jgi:serine/threonine-protein kinase
MALSPGDKLGAYEVLTLLGVGGMGEVYRARDTKLGRDVAIKILPELFVADPERVSRFGREAQVLASLNHTNIASIYGLEESGSTRFLVLELVEGQSLAQWLSSAGRVLSDPPANAGSKGPGLHVDECLAIARQLVDALEAAHERGIVHRDLKPANIMLTAEGHVKVLDFGLARIVEPNDASSIANSPTLTFAATQTGVILGTAAYMSPEQAKGRVADKRSDIWAFGSVLYEMLTGRRAFEGEDISDTLAAILRSEPDYSAIPAAVPPHVTQVIARCLEKDRKKRIPDIAVVRYLLDESPKSNSPADVPTASPVARRGPRWIVGMTSLVATAAVAALAWGLTRPDPPPRPDLMRFGVPVAPLPLNSPFRDLTITPDGRHIVYSTGTAPGTGGLWVRSMSAIDPVELKTGTAPRWPFISPDSNWIGFFQGGELRKVSVTGGPVFSLCKYEGSVGGATWSTDGTIVFAAAGDAHGLMQVPEGGGEPKVLTTNDVKNSDHVFPSFLPNRRAVLFTVRTPSNEGNFSDIVLLDLETGSRKTLIRGGSQAEYVEPGYLLYATENVISAVRFDLDRLEVIGSPVQILENVVTKSSGAADYAITRNGTLVYVPGGVRAAERRSLVWVDRDGREEPLAAPPRAYLMARLAPDGTRVALDIRDQDNDIWTWDLAHGTLMKVTNRPGIDMFPVWAADSRRLFFASVDTVPNIYVQSSDGTGKPERVTTSSLPQLSLSLAPDGRLIARQENLGRPPDVISVRLSDGGAPSASSEDLIKTSYLEDNAIVSPDGRWIAYESNESAQTQIYVRPYPNVNDGRTQVSSTGGRAPLWSPDGKELFLLETGGGGLLTVVPVKASTTTGFSFGKATTVLKKPYFVAQVRSYDISRDGKRFPMIKFDEGADSSNAPPLPSVHVVLNWVEELKARVK